MRLLINTGGIRFRAGGPAKAKSDYSDKSKQAMTPDGRPIWVVRLTAFDTSSEHGSSESIWVEVAGDEPKLTFDGDAAVSGLTYAPWVNKETHKIVRAWRADQVSDAPAVRRAA